MQQGEMRLKGPGGGGGGGERAGRGEGVGGGWVVVRRGAKQHSRRRRRGQRERERERLHRPTKSKSCCAVGPPCLTLFGRRCYRVLHNTCNCCTHWTPFSTIIRSIESLWLWRYPEHRIARAISAVAASASVFVSVSIAVSVSGAVAAAFRPPMSDPPRAPACAAKPATTKSLSRAVNKHRNPSPPALHTPASRLPPIPPPPATHTTHHGHPTLARRPTRRPPHTPLPARVA